MKLNYIYQIITVGDTNWTSIGASAGEIGEVFQKNSTTTTGTTGTAFSYQTMEILSHRSAEVVESNLDLNLITYKMLSPAASGTEFVIDKSEWGGEPDDRILTDSKLFSFVNSDAEERSAIKYYEVIRTNSDGTVDRLQTNKTLSSEDITNLPSGFSTVPVAVSNWEHESRENEKNRSVNILDSNNLDAFETDFVSKMSD